MRRRDGRTVRLCCVRSSCARKPMRLVYSSPHQLRRYPLRSPVEALSTEGLAVQEAMVRPSSLSRSVRCLGDLYHLGPAPRRNLRCLCRAGSGIRHLGINCRRLHRRDQRCLSSSHRSHQGEATMSSRLLRCLMSLSRSADLLPHCDTSRSPTESPTREQSMCEPLTFQAHHRRHCHRLQLLALLLLLLCLRQRHMRHHRLEFKEEQQEASTSSAHQVRGRGG